MQDSATGREEYAKAYRCWGSMQGLSPNFQLIGANRCVLMSARKTAMPNRDWERKYLLGE